jgi:hypothetical protein
LDTSDEDAVFETINQLVLSGEYLDAISGSPDVRLEGGGWFKQTRQGSLRRVYTRGSPEHLDAKQACALEPLPPRTPAPIEAVEAAESVIGFSLPRLLRRLYLQVANGGFGPGYGMLGVRGGHTDNTSRTAVDLYIHARAASSGAWRWMPDGLLPICHWGCAIYSFVDCSHPDGPIWGWDPNPGPSDERALFPQSMRLAEWLSRWVTRQLYQPTLVQDPLSQHWRGTSDEEMARWMAEVDL